MRYQVVMEETEGHWVAYIPRLPGCYASGNEQLMTLAEMSGAIHKYILWRQSKGDPTIKPDTNISLDVDEIIREWVHPTNPDYIINAFFAADLPPLGSDEVELCQDLLDWTYADLLAVCAGLSEETLKKPVEGEWSINTILLHTARAEWWYLSNLNLAPQVDPKPAFWKDRLDLTQRHLKSVLPGLTGHRNVEENHFEFWSPRKMIRRLLWHRRDHTQHISKFRTVLGSDT